MITEDYTRTPQAFESHQQTGHERIFLDNLFSELNAATIRYAVMRNYLNLPFSTNGSDLDMLVHPEDTNPAKKIIFDAIKRSNGVPIGHVNMPGFLKMFVLGFLETEAKTLSWWGLRLDISCGLLFKGAANLLEWRDDQIITHNGVRVLNDSLANVLGVLKEVLNNNQLPERYLAAARKDIDASWSNISLALAPMGEKALHLFKALLTESIVACAISDKCAALRKDLRHHAFRQTPLGYLKRRALFEWSKVRRYITPPRIDDSYSWC